MLKVGDLLKVHYPISLENTNEEFSALFHNTGPFKAQTVGSVIKAVPWGWEYNKAQLFYMGRVGACMYLAQHEWKPYSSLFTVNRKGA